MAHINESVTTDDLARDLNGIIDKVRTSGNSVYITECVQTVAELAPPPKQAMSLGKLIELLQSTPSLGEDGPAMADDLARIRRSVKQKQLLELFGKLEWEADYDYKSERTRE
jgi:hypothetical protein